MLMEKLQPERLMSAIWSVSGIEKMLENIVEYCRRTIVDGKPLSKSQAIKFSLAEMATEVKMNRVFLDNLIHSHMNGDDVTAETMMAKYKSSELSREMIENSIGIMGEDGLLEVNRFARIFRDLRVSTIYAGTTEIMKTIIAGTMNL